MAIIQMPTTLACGRGCRIEQVTVDAVGVSDPSGNGQARSYGVPKWALSLVSYELLNDAEAGAWKVMLLGLRGSVNYLAAFDPSRPYPVGSLRGSLTLGAGAAQGDTSITISGGSEQAGQTVIVGDWFQIGSGLGTSQLVMCMADYRADGSGNLLLTFEPPLRMAFASGTAVTWDHPRGYFRKLPGRVGWTPYSQTFAQGMGLDALEAW